MPGANRSFEVVVKRAVGDADLAELEQRHHARPGTLTDYIDASEPVSEPPRRARLEVMERCLGVPWRALFLFFAIDADLWPRDYAPDALAEVVKARYEQADDDVQRGVLDTLGIATQDDVEATLRWALRQ